jgi:anti-sigma factor RsiW
VTEDELHAYVDGELAADRREAVEAWLISHPEDATLVATWRAQADAIRARYGGIVSEPVPQRLNLDRLARNGRRWRAVAVAATIAAFVIGGVAGWMARGASAAAPSNFDIFTTEALSAHKLYIAEVRHPIEVKAGENHLLPWLSKRVGTTLRAPDLGAFGLKLLGGRLLPGVGGPAALFMYENAGGERFTIYCSRLEVPHTALRYSLTDKFAAVHWVDNEYGYVVSGPADRDRLVKIAEAAYLQMENRAPGTKSEAEQLISRKGS